MKIERVIQLAGLMERGNVLPEELAIEFLSEFDGMIQSDIMLHAPEEIVRYDSKDQELLLRPPHDGLYLSFLVAMIRQCQGEFEGYNNAQEIVEDKLKTFRRWYVSHYRPADTCSRDYTGGTSGGDFGFAYLSAYGLAVKHGYQGTEEEWLQSLKGEEGDPGEAARMRYDAERDMVQWGVGDEWHDLYTMAQVLAPLYEKLEEMTARTGEDAPSSATEGRVGSLYLQTGVTPKCLWVCVGADDGIYRWQQCNVYAELDLRDSGDGGVLLVPEGTETQPVLNLYGRYSDENVILRGVAPAQNDTDVPNLRQVQELVNNDSGGGGYVASDEPPENTKAMWVDTSEPEEAVALGVTAVETDEGVEFYCTDELGTTKATVRHGKDGKDASQNAGLTAEERSTLIAVVNAIGVFSVANGQELLDAFNSAWGGTAAGKPSLMTPDVTLTSISVVYGGGDVAVDTAVTDLTGIVVTAHYSDGSTATVTEYTLSGEIAEGENTVTVTYQGRTATFTVTGVSEGVKVYGVGLPWETPSYGEWTANGCWYQVHYNATTASIQTGNGFTAEKVYSKPVDGSAFKYFRIPIAEEEHKYAVNSWIKIYGCDSPNALTEEGHTVTECTKQYTFVPCDFAEDSDTEGVLIFQPTDHYAYYYIRGDLNSSLGKTFPNLLGMFDANILKNPLAEPTE